MEGLTEEDLSPQQMISYLEELARVTKMERLSGPGVYTAHECGMMAWIHWKTSGASMYTYPANAFGKQAEHPLFTVDCYTCKPFASKEAAEFTKEYLKALDLVWREVNQ